MGYYLTNQVIQRPAESTDALQSHLGTNTPIGAPFGNPILSTKYWDEDSKLSYYGYRYLSPGMGRWLSKDPIEEEGGLNHYAFILNTINEYDVLGLWGNEPPGSMSYQAYEYYSEGYAARDPERWMYSEENESGITKTGDAYYSHVNIAKKGWNFAICNSGYIMENSHITIKAKSTCCRKYNATCNITYTAAIWHDKPGVPNTGNQISVHMTALGEEYPNAKHPWLTVAAPDASGVYKAEFKTGFSVNKTVQINQDWSTLFTSIPTITVGTRIGGDDGPWIGAGFVESFSVSCSLKDAGKCD